MYSKKVVDPLALEKELKDKVKVFLDDLYAGKGVYEILFLSEIVSMEIDSSLPKYVDVRDLHY